MSRGQIETAKYPSRTDGVAIKATARLHMGFFDLNGNLGRRFGSLGVSLEDPATEMQAFRQNQISADGPGAARAVKIANQIANGLNLQGGMHMQLTQAIPEHAGLGSGTQMSLVVGTAFSQLYNLNLSLRDIAMLTARGARSGIGIGTFATGGVIVDGGRSADTDLPPVIARCEFPSGWRILLIFDRTESGVHGPQEIEAFRTLPQFPAESAAELCRYVLMQALPALAEHDLPSFGRAIRELQHRTGDYFSPAQGGRYASPKITAVLQKMEEAGVECLGQSSWGPTGFAVFADESHARQVTESLKSHLESAGLEYSLTKSNNTGAVIAACEDVLR